MKTTLYGHETTEDRALIAELEVRFCQPLTFFLCIRPRSDFKHEDVYWHIRVKGYEGVYFVRRDLTGETHIYGPVKGEVMT